jgi:FixJ family two-component response regulator
MSTAVTGERRILIADPDEPLLGRLAPPLEQAGYLVETVVSGRALLNRLRGRSTGLVALAADLPDLSGGAVVEKMREVCATPPIIFIACHGADPRRSPSRQDVAAVFFKPVDPTAFLGACQRVLHFKSQRFERRLSVRRALRVAVVVETRAGAALPATLIELSSGGFRLELPSGLPAHERVRVLMGAGESQGPAFEGTLEWQAARGRTVIAGGRVLSVGTEDERILTALAHPLA